MFKLLELAGRLVVVVALLITTDGEKADEVLVRKFGSLPGT